MQGTQNTKGSTLFCFPKSKQIICLLEGWIRYKTVNKCKQMYFIPQTVQLIFGGLNINNKQCSTFTFMCLGLMFMKMQEREREIDSNTKTSSPNHNQKDVKVNCFLVQDLHISLIRFFKSLDRYHRKYRFLALTLKRNTVELG